MPENIKKSEDSEKFTKKEKSAESEKTKNPAKFLRIGGILAIAVVLFLIVIISLTSKTPISEQVWNPATTLGDAETANHHYILYTDVMCPYCAVLAQTIQHNQSEFENWLSEHKVLYEVRATDYLYEGGSSKYSRPAAEATYCATRENKFWDFYHAAMEKMYKEYQSKGIGISKTSPQISNLPDDYFLKIGHSVGLGETFDNCIKNHETVSEIEENTKKAAKVAEGVPFMVYDGKAGGIDAQNGWDGVKLYLETGLKK